MKYFFNIILIFFLVANVSSFAKKDNFKVYLINPEQLNELHNQYLKIN